MTKIPRAEREMMALYAAALMDRYKVDHFEHEGLQTFADPVKRTWGYKCACQGDHENAWSCEWAMRDFKLIAAHMRDRVYPGDGRIAQEVEAERKANELAHAKAFDLLKRVLSTKQKGELDKHGYFHVQAADQRRYRLYLSSGHNVELVKGRKVLKRFCILPSISVPTPDKVLAQKLLLEGDVKTFLKTANHHDP